MKKPRLRPIFALAPGQLSPFEPSELRWFIHRSGPDDLTTVAASRGDLHARLDLIPVGRTTLWVLYRTALHIPEKLPLEHVDITVPDNPLARGVGRYFVFGDRGRDAIWIPPLKPPGPYVLGFDTHREAAAQIAIFTGSEPTLNERFIIARLHECIYWH